MSADEIYSMSIIYGICIPWKKLVELKYVKFEEMDADLEDLDSEDDYTQIHGIINSNSKHELKVPSLFPLEVFYVPREMVDDMSKNRPGFIPGGRGQEIVCVGIKIMSFGSPSQIDYPSLSKIADASRLFGVVAPENITGNGGKRDLIFTTLLKSDLIQ
jgi:hypothetical protein